MVEFCGLGLAGGPDTSIVSEIVWALALFETCYVHLSFYNNIDNIISLRQYNPLRGMNGHRCIMFKSPLGI